MLNIIINSLNTEFKYVFCIYWIIDIFFYIEIIVTIIFAKTY